MGMAVGSAIPVDEITLSFSKIDIKYNILKPGFVSPSYRKSLAGFNHHFLIFRFNPVSNILKFNGLDPHGNVGAGFSAFLQWMKLHSPSENRYQL